MYLLYFQIFLSISANNCCLQSQTTSQRIKSVCKNVMRENSFRLANENNKKHSFIHLCVHPPTKSLNI